MVIKKSEKDRQKETNQKVYYLKNKVDIVTTQKDAMMLVMARQDKSIPILLMIDIDQHLNLLEKICQSIQFDRSINIVPVGKKKELQDIYVYAVFLIRL